MKIPTFIRLAVVLLFAAPALAAPIDLAQWSHIAQIDLPSKPAKGLVELPLTPELFAISRPDLADLRLYSPDNQPVPFVLRNDHGESSTPIAYHPTRLFNPVFEPHKLSTVTVDFGAPAPGAGAMTRTRLDIDTPGANFRRRVSIEASTDGQSWQVLRASAWLFHITYESSNFSKNDITLPDNDFRYLRITVFNDSADPAQIPIDGVTAWHIKNTPAKALDVPTHSVNVTQSPESKTTDIEADLRYENLPASELTLAFDDANFVRRVEVFGRNVKSRTIIEPVENSQPRKREVDEPWSHLAGGTVYRFPGTDAQDSSTGLTLPLNSQSRYLLVRIYNNDDAPLKFTSLKVQRLQTHLAFKADRAGAYALYAGNPTAQMPQYDLDQFAGRLRAEGITEAFLAPLTPNPFFSVPVKVIPWSERYVWLLWVILIAVFAILATLVLRQSRHAKPLT